MRGEEGEHLNSLVWAGDRFVAVGAGATSCSPDGTTWQREPNTGAPVTVVFGKHLFVVANRKGLLLRSTDGVKWAQTYPAEHHFAAVCFGG